MIIKTTLTDPESEGVWLGGNVGLRNEAAFNSGQRFQKFTIELRGGNFIDRIACSFSVGMLLLDTFPDTFPLKGHNIYTATTYDSSTNITTITGRVHALYSANIDEVPPTVTDVTLTYSSVTNIVHPFPQASGAYVRYLIFISRETNSMVAVTAANSPCLNTAITTVDVAVENLKGIMK